MSDKVDSVSPAGDKPWTAPGLSSKARAVATVQGWAAHRKPYRSLAVFVEEAIDAALRDVLGAADLYWTDADPEASGTEPQDFVDTEVIEPVIGKVYTFSCAKLLPDERWRATATTRGHDPCPKCGGLVQCEDFLGQGCEAEALELLKVEA